MGGQVDRTLRGWLQPPRRVAVADEVLAALLHWISLIVGGLTVLVAIGTVATIGTDLQHITANILVVVMVLVTQVLLRTGYVRAAAQGFVFSLWAVISVWLFRAGGTSSPIVLSYFAVIATTSVLLSRRMSLVYAMMSAAVLGVLYLAEAAGYTSTDPYTPPLRFVVVSAGMMMTGFVIYFASKLREDASARALESEHQYAELVHTAPEALLTVDADGVVRGNNPAAQTLFQLGSNLVGSPVRSLPGLERLSETADGIPLSCVIARPDGSRRQVEVDVRPLTFLGRKGTRVSVRDVTTQHEAERDRAILTEQLNQVQKQDSIGLLAGGIAHDFNNIITVLLSNLEVLKAMQQAPEALELVAETEQASQRAASLTRQLLAFSRRQVLHARNVSLSDAVEELRPMLRRLLSENIELRCTLDAKGIVRADTGQLQQVLVNLVVNASDAMPRGGVIHLKTADHLHHEPKGGAPRGPFVCLSVEDTGPGMTPEVAARAFEPFFTTKGPGKGTGLGLSVVDGIVRQSGGVVTVDSTLGKGTRFDVCLPRVEASTPDAVVSEMSPEGTGGGRTVMLIEDEAPLRRVMASVLEAAGFKVLPAADGEEALRLAADPAVVIDLVVTDVVMPQLGGPEAVQKLRAQRPSLKALFVSGYTDRTLEELGAASPGSAFLGKPFRPPEMVAAALALLARG